MSRADWEVVIGIETHAQLKTASKIFSGASTAFGAEPNTQACAVDVALPGVLPVLNKEAVAHAIRFGLAVGAEVAPRSVFARKNYFYPDLPKGYQISQFELPVVSGGGLTIVTSAGSKNVRLTRAHLEEDAGKSIHELDNSLALSHGRSGIDLNRAGTPLLEIVSEPDMRSAEEAVAYAKALHALVTWIDICDGNMQEGSFRCDANVSVRRKGESKLGTRREIKNLNSFRFLQQAIEYEIDWQIEQIEDGHAIVQATVLFDPDSGETRMMRSKEDAHDYRYFPDPDLLPLVIDADWIGKVKADMPELPAAMQQRFQSDWGLSEYDAVTLTASLDTARYFIDAGNLSKGEYKAAANWINGEIAALLNKRQININDPEVPSPEELAMVISRIKDGTISNAGAKKLFQALCDKRRLELESFAKQLTTASVQQIIDDMISASDLRQMNDSGALEAIIDEVLANNAKSVEEFRSGKDKAFNALVGQIMKASKGKANPQQVNDLLRAKLSS